MSSQGAALRINGEALKVNGEKVEGRREALNGDSYALTHWTWDLSGKLFRRYKTEPEINRAMWRHKKYILKNVPSTETCIYKAAITGDVDELRVNKKAL